MKLIGAFLRQINKAEGGKNSDVFARLMFDSRERRKITAPPGDVGESGDLRYRSIRIRCRGQFCTEQELRNAHRLIDKNLFLFFLAFAPTQNRFDSNNGRLKFQNALQQQRAFNRGRRIFAASIHECHWHRLRRRLRMPNEPTQENFLGTLEARFAQK